MFQTGRGCCLVGALAVLAVPSPPVQAASSNAASTANLLRANGSGEVVNSGDWVTDAAAPALDTAYRFFIEVPPGLPTLVVEVFDPDIGRGGNQEGTRDLLTGNTFNTSVIYTLLDPNNAQVGPTITCSNAANPAVCVDNAWSALFGNVNNPIAGHWQLVVDPSDVNGQNGDETMAYGVRAHDGNSGAGGVEIPVYADSYIGLGPTTQTQQVNIVHPWVTSGCTAVSNDFDADSAAGTNYTLAGNVGFTQNFTTVSANGTWRSNASNKFTSDITAQNYGIWNATVDVRKANGSAANVITYYVASQFAAVAGTGNPINPRNQPAEPGIFRMYFDTDAGAAPAKPFVEQFVRSLGGANPPAAGQVSTLTITVVVHNPTTLPITFNAAHPVTTTVPAAPVAFSGGLQVSQGSATTPAVGGNGNIVWNPGVVVAGATALLAYNVTVTPAAAGQRLVLTGPTATGTTAKYIDETGNTTQARATTNFGPLCELAVTVGTNTFAAVVDVAGERHDGVVDVSWRTAGEAGAVAFSLERVDGDARVPVGPLVPSVMRMQGGSYAVRDDGAPGDGPVSYFVVEHDARGALLDYGPFTVLDDSAATSVAPGPVLTGGAGFLTRANLASLADAPSPVQDEATVVDTLASAPDRLRIRVVADGIVGVPLVQIAALLRRSPTRIIDDARVGNLAISLDGVDVPYDVRDGVLGFFGRAPVGPFAAARTYFLRVRSGTKAANAVVDPAGAAVTRSSSTATQVFEQNLIPGVVVDLDPFSDLWFWASFFADDTFASTFTTTLTVDDDDGAPAHLTLALQGASESGVPDEHHARVLVNGAFVGEMHFTGIRRVEQTFDLPAGILVSPVDVEIDAVHDEGVPSSSFFLDQLRVTHERAFVGTSAFVFSGSAGDVVHIAGADPSSWFYDVDSGALIRLDDAHVDASGLTARLPADGTYAYAPGPAHPVSMVAAPTPPSLATGGADVVVISSTRLLRGAQTLAAWHRERGLVSRVVDMQDVLDAYAASANDPRAIPRFLADVKQLWSPQPRYVVLVGDGDLDFEDATQLHENHIPPFLVRTDVGIAASDNAAVDTDDDGLPDFAVGRIPARTVAEVNDYVARARTFTGPAHATFLADQRRAADDFSASAAGLAALTALPKTEIELDGSTLATTRAAVFAAIDAGGLLTFVGHGGMDRMGFSAPIIGMDDVDKLKERGPWAAIALTCLINRFEVPGIAGLGEHLVRDGGAVVVLAPSLLSNAARADDLGAHLLSRMSTGGAIGDIVKDGESAFVGGGGARDLPQLYILLGDPTLPFAKSPQPSATLSSCAATGDASVVILGLLLLLRIRRRR